MRVRVSPFAPYFKDNVKELVSWPEKDQMQSTLEVAEGLERKLHISVPSDDVESLFQQKLKNKPKTLFLTNLLNFLNYLEKV